MKRTVINLTDKQDQLLRVFSKNNGYSVSEVIRRAIDEYLRSELKDGYYNFEDNPIKSENTQKEEDT